MKEYKTEDIRNLAIIGHSSSGKTVLTDAILYTAGVISRIGKTDEGSTVSDYTNEEIERQISLRNALVHLEWKNKKINVIDTPGYMDFAGDAKGAVKIADTGIISISATSGVEVGTEFSWEFLQEMAKLPLFAMTMLDKEHTNFDEYVEKLQERFGNAVYPVQFPINAGPAFNAIIDLIKRKLYEYDENGKSTEKEIPAEFQDKADEMYEKMIELIAESDDTLLEKFFEEGSLSDEDVAHGLHKAIMNRNIIPIVSLSSYNKVGIDRLLDIIGEYYPNPAEMPAMPAVNSSTHAACEVAVDAAKPFSAFIFKTIHEQHVGDMSFLKVQTGELKPGMDVVNVSNGDHERIGTIFQLNGKNRHEVNVLTAGDIGVLVKLKNTRTNNTLADDKKAFLYEGIKFPDPTIRAALLLKAKGDEEKIGQGLSQVHGEDPTFHYVIDPELKQTIISGQGEIHLEVSMKKIKDQFNIEVDLVEPKVPYRETIRKPATARYRHKKQSGGAGQFGEVELKIEPLPRSGGIEFVSALVGQNVDRAFVPSVEKGFRNSTTTGPLSGNQVIDIKASFVDGKQHPVDSKDIAFQIAGRGAFQEAFINADPVLLEPIFEIEVKVPEEYMGDVMGDVSSRRGKVTGMDSDGHFQIIKAEVPLANLYKYSTILRSITQGRGFHRRKFAYYEYVPREIQEKIVEEYRKHREEGN